MEVVPAFVGTFAKQGYLARVVVIHLGSNRPFEDPVFDEVMKRLLAQLHERVIFINVHRPIGWEYYLNQRFAGSVARWPEAELLDWDAMAHLSYAGSESYVNAIKQMLLRTP